MGVEKASAVSSCLHCFPPGFLYRFLSAWVWAMGAWHGGGAGPATSLSPGSPIYGNRGAQNPFSITRPKGMSPGLGQVTLQGPSGRNQGCGFGWGRWPLLGAQHLEAIRPGAGGVAREGWEGGHAFSGPHTGPPLGSSGFGPMGPQASLLSLPPANASWPVASPPSAGCLLSHPTGCCCCCSCKMQSHNMQ